MTMMTMNLVIPRRDRRTGRRRSMLRAGHLLTARLSVALNLTPQQRADRYVARMPIAVIAP